MGECKLIGANDARFNRNATSNVVASSHTGVLYRIKAVEFLKHLKNDDDTWLRFTQVCVANEKQHKKVTEADLTNQSYERPNKSIDYNPISKI